MADQLILLPDGGTVAVPDGADLAQVEAALKERFPQPTSLEPGERLKVGHAEVYLIADVARYVICDWRGQAVGLRPTLAEAIALARDQPPEPPARVVREPPPPPPPHAGPSFKELRLPWPPPRQPRVLRRPPPRRR